MNLIVVVFVVFAVSLVSCMPASGEKRPEAETKKVVRYCQPQTPCGWKIYNFIDYPEMNVTNDYCKCRQEQKCDFYENKHGHGEGYIEYRCKNK